MKTNWTKKEFTFGASTLSQQTVKNLFLSSSRNPLRKWHELVLTLAMERNLTKHRILEIYLNIAEFGQGVYGIEAASYHYWGVSSKYLIKQRAIQLTACLPSPKKHNPLTNSKRFKKRVNKISSHLAQQH